MKRVKDRKLSGTEIAESDAENAQPVIIDSESESDMESTLTIEYSDDDAEDMEISARINTDADDREWTITSGEGNEGITGRIVEEWDNIVVAPVDIHGKRRGAQTTTIADYEPGFGRIEPQHLKHDGKSVNAIVGDVIDETLGPLVKAARKEYQAERDIQPVAQSDVDVPEIELEIQNGAPLFSSSNIGARIASRDVLVVEPVTESDAYDHWHKAVVETTNRRQVWASTQHKDMDKLLAPPKYEVGDHLTLAEFLDAWYIINPETVADAMDRPKTMTDSITDLSIGDIVEINEMPDQNGDTKTGVVSQINSATEDIETRARIKWDKRTYSDLKEADGRFQLGHAMGGGFRKIKGARVIEGLSRTADDLLEVRENVLDLAAFDERVDEADLDIIDEASWSDGRDKRGYLLVDGDFVDTIVQITVANIFDGGWAANIPDVVDVDDETEEILIRFARRNSPITTAIRVLPIRKRTDD